MRTQGVRDTDDRFESVTLRAASRCFINDLVRCSRFEVEDAAHGLRWYVRAVVADGEPDELPLLAHLYADLRRRACRLADVKRVVHKLLECHGSKVTKRLTGLGLQFTRIEVLHSPRDLEGHSF